MSYRSPARPIRGLSFDLQIRYVLQADLEIEVKIVRAWRWHRGASFCKDHRMWLDHLCSGGGPSVGFRVARRCR